MTLQRCKWPCVPVTTLQQDDVGGIDPWAQRSHLENIQGVISNRQSVPLIWANRRSLRNWLQWSTSSHRLFSWKGTLCLDQLYEFRVDIFIQTQVQASAGLTSYPYYNVRVTFLKYKLNSVIINLKPFSGSPSIVHSQHCPSSLLNMPSISSEILFSTNKLLWNRI